MTDREKCLYYREGRCANPKPCHGGFKVHDKEKHCATCKTDGVVWNRSAEFLYKAAER